MQKSVLRFHHVERVVARASGGPLSWRVDEKRKLLSKAHTGSKRVEEREEVKKIAASSCDRQVSHTQTYGRPFVCHRFLSLWRDFSIPHIFIVASIVFFFANLSSSSGLFCRWWQVRCCLNSTWMVLHELWEKWRSENCWWRVWRRLADVGKCELGFLKRHNLTVPKPTKLSSCSV